MRSVAVGVPGVGRLPVLESPLVRLVRLGETQRGVERDRELQEHERDLLVGAAALEQRKQRAVVADRRVERPFEAGAVAGPSQVEHRLVLGVPGEGMVREQAEHLVAVLGVALLEPAHRLAVELLAVGGEQRPVRGFLDQRVLEPVLGLGPPTGLADQVDALEGVQRLLERAVGARHALEQRQSEPPAEDGRCRQDVAIARGEPVDAGEDHFLDGRRDDDLRLVVEAPALAFANEHARLGERADELLEVERVALGSFQDLLFEVVRDRALAEQRDEELAVGVSRRKPRARARVSGAGTARRRSSSRATRGGPAPFGA